MTPELLAMLTPVEAKAWALCEGAALPWHGDRNDGTVKYDVLDADGSTVIHGCNNNCDPSYGFYSDEAERFVLGASVALPLALTTIATLRADLAEVQARHGRAWEALCTIGDAVDKAGHYTLIPERALHVGSAVNALIAEAEELRAELRTVADLIQEVGVLGIASTMDAVVVSGQPSARDLLTWAAKAMDAWPKERQALRDRLVMAEEREREMVIARDILRETLAEQQREIADLRAQLSSARWDLTP